MVGISERDPAVLEALDALTRHPNFAVLVKEIGAAREQYFVNLARGLATNPSPVDQREIDAKRGFWQGAIWALSTFPKLASKDWKKFVEAALKEAEEA